ncbi:MAG: alpha/beta fold hydrolase [Rubrimonas sp.]|uniref:alpha/beta fold hydrolase n=1 Tax=Rubrimonas sp. TaxID=2036015 RepID=UPI002FDCCF56
MSAAVLPALDAPARFWRAVAALAAVEEAEIAIGPTPSDPVFRRDKLTLRRYRPRAAADPRLPPLIVAHGLVGRPTMTDLDADRSLARDLLERGVDLFSLDWGAPGRAERFVSLADCVDDLLAGCVAHVTEATSRRPALLGVCEGGVFGACLAARDPETLAGLALIVTPIDFHADPAALLPRWIRAIDRETLEGLVDALGGLPGGAMGSAFHALTPVRSRRKYTSQLVATADDPAALRAFLRMERWIADRPHHPGEAARQMLCDCYRDNLLIAGDLILDGRAVDLREIAAPTLIVCGRRDHIVPPPCSLALAPLLTRAPCRALTLDAGHIGVFVSARARGQLGAALVDWLRADALPA